MLNSDKLQTIETQKADLIGIFFAEVVYFQIEIKTEETKGEIERKKQFLWFWVCNCNFFARTRMCGLSNGWSASHS